MLSFIVPTLNDGHRLPATLERLAAYEGPKEIIVCDAGSKDQTFAVTARAGGKFYMAPTGRGQQLAQGAEVSIGDWMLFLHADTKLGPGWITAVNRFMENPGNRFRAGYFIFALDDPSPSAKRLEKLVGWRCRNLSLPYGDQGLLMSRALYERIGGYSPIPLMEDVDLIRRIQNHRLECLPALAITSAERFQKGGYIFRPLKNLFCLGLFMLGISPRIINDIYR
jgi:rSAM/selenodomain-associated transferase 2